MAFVPITPVNLSLAGLTASSFSPMNIPTLTSGTVPTTATGACLVANYSSGHLGVIATRMSGSGDNFGTAAASMGGPGQVELVMGLGSGGNLGSMDVYASSLTGLGIQCVGYYDGRAGWLQTAVSLGTAALGYTNYSISGIAPSGAVAAVIGFNGAQGSWGARYGASGASSDDWNGNAHGSSGSAYAIVGVDGSGNLQVSTSSTTINVMLYGWIMSGLVWHKNGINVTPSVAGSPQNLPPTSGSSGGIYQLAEPLGQVYTYLIGASGATGALGSFEPVKGSSGQICSGAPPTANISNTSLLVYELGYWLPPATGPNIPIGRCTYTLP